MATTTFGLQDLIDRDLDDTLAGLDQRKIEVQIEDAIALVDDTCPTVAERLQSGTLKPAVYKARLAKVLLRITRNVSGYQSESEGGASYTMQPVVGSGDLWLSQADIDAFNQVRPQGPTLPGSVSLGVDAGWARS